MEGSGLRVVADGYRVDYAAIVEAKFVDTSPYGEASPVPTRVRDLLRASHREELRRYRAVIQDTDNPTRQLEIVTNDPAAVPYFRALLEEAGIPGGARLES